MVSARKVIESQQPVFAERLSPLAKRQLIEKFQENDRVNVMFGPKVTVFDGREAMIEDTTKRPFVVGVETRDNNTPTFTEGTQLLLKATSKENNTVRLDLRIRFSDILDVQKKDTGLRDLKVQVSQVGSWIFSLRPSYQRASALRSGGWKKI